MMVKLWGMGCSNPRHFCSMKPAAWSHCNLQPTLSDPFGLKRLSQGNAANVHKSATTTDVDSSRIAPALDDGEGLGFPRARHLGSMESAQPARYARRHGRFTHLLGLERAHAQPALEAAVRKARQHLCKGSRVVADIKHDVGQQMRFISLRWRKTRCWGSKGKPRHSEPCSGLSFDPLVTIFVTMARLRLPKHHDDTFPSLT